MILRKPYAFLIKHFKIIHLFLSIILGIILYKTNLIYKFIVNYINKSNYLKLYVEPDISSVGISIFLLIALVLFIFVSIFILMKKKNKPTKFYTISILFYSLLIILFLLVNSQIYNLILNRATLRIINIFRDLLNISCWLQYIFVFISAIRAIGFNIKKFGFQQDLKEFEVKEEDREEFEVAVEIDTDDTKMKFRRFFRIVKYILKENKKILIAICSFIFLILIVNVLLNVFIYNRVYKENQSFKFNNLTYQITNSYETTNNYSMEKISSNKIYYIVRFKIKNDSSQNITINTNNIYLRIGKTESYQPNLKLYNNFVDLGMGYNNQIIKSNEETNYILVYEINSDKIKSKKTLEFLKGYSVENGKLEYAYTKVKLDPINLDKAKNEKNSSIGNDLVMNNTVVGNIKMNISDIEILDKIEYEYKETINNKEYKFIDIIQPTSGDYYGKKMMKLNLTLEFSDVLYNKSIEKFLGKYSVIRYKKNNREYISPFRTRDLTPDDVVGTKYIEVPEEVINADNIYLDIILRNKKYTYTLK